MCLEIRHQMHITCRISLASLIHARQTQTLPMPSWTPIRQWNVEPVHVHNCPCINNCTTIARTIASQLPPTTNWATHGPKTKPNVNYPCFRACQKPTTNGSHEWLLATQPNKNVASHSCTLLNGMPSNPQPFTTHIDYNVVNTINVCKQNQRQHARRIRSIPAQTWSRESTTVTTPP